MECFRNISFFLSFGWPEPALGVGSPPFPAGGLGLHVPAEVTVRGTLYLPRTPVPHAASTALRGLQESNGRGSCTSRNCMCLSPLLSNPKTVQNETPLSPRGVQIHQYFIRSCTVILSSGCRHGSPREFSLNRRGRHTS